MFSSIQQELELQGGTQHMSILMTYHTTVRNQQCQIQLNYEKLQKNLGKLIKIHNQAENLHILPREEAVDKGNSLLMQTFNHTAPLRRSCIEQRPIPHHSYPLNSEEAVQLIWRAAKIAKQLRTTPAALKNIQKDIEKNQYIGESNKMAQLISAIQREIKILTKKLGENHTRTLKARKYLQRLQFIQEYIAQSWRDIRLHHERVFEKLKNYPIVSLYTPNLSQAEKALISSHILKQILALDRLLLKDTIMFIMNIKNSEDCLVVLQQCYFPFLTKQHQLCEMIGKKAYMQGLKSYEMVKELSFAEEQPFRIKRFSMCHKCMDIFTPDQNAEDSYICTHARPFPDATTTSYAYQQIVLLANYSVIPEFYQKSKAKIEQIKYDKYVHPYAKTLSPFCSRFACNQCFASYSVLKKRKNQHIATEQQATVQVSQAKNPQMKRQLRSSNNLNQQLRKKDETQKTEKPKVKKPQYCHFCESLCECERCMNLQKFNKLLALYGFFDGDFQSISSELIFYNWLNVKMDIVMVYEDQLQAYDKLVQLQMFRNKKTDNQKAQKSQMKVKKIDQTFSKSGNSKKERKNQKKKQEQTVRQQKDPNSQYTIRRQAHNSDKQEQMAKIKQQNSTMDSLYNTELIELKELFIQIRLQEDFESYTCSEHEQSTPISYQEKFQQKLQKKDKGQKAYPVKKTANTNKPVKGKSFEKDKIRNQVGTVKEDDYYFESQDQNCIN